MYRYVGVGGRGGGVCWCALHVYLGQCVCLCLSFAWPQGDFPCLYGKIKS